MSHDELVVLEGIIATQDANGKVNLAPMGPRVPAVLEGMTWFELRPYKSSRTYHNLKHHPEGVLHVTDDVLLLARCLVDAADPPLTLATKIVGQRLRDCCRFFEFRIDAWDEREDRTRLRATVVHAERVRDFFGLHRARHAVVEAAVAASRVGILPMEEIQRELDRSQLLVNKTGGANEQNALALLREWVARRGHQHS